MEKEINRENLVYREKASAIVVNNSNEILLIQKHDYGDNHWDVPGGGVDEGESHQQAILRELEEELGSDKFEITEKSEIVNQYEFPDFVIERDMAKGSNFRGQKVVQFIVEFKGKDSDLDIDEKEIKKYKWVGFDELKSHLNFPGQWENIEKVIGNSEYRNI